MRAVESGKAFKRKLRAKAAQERFDALFIICVVLIFVVRAGDNGIIRTVISVNARLGFVGLRRVRHVGFMLDLFGIITRIIGNNRRFVILRIQIRIRELLDSFVDVLRLKNLLKMQNPVDNSAVFDRRNHALIGRCHHVHDARQGFFVVVSEKLIVAEVFAQMDDIRIRR